MDTTQIMDIIKNPLLAINEKFDQSTKNINDFMGEALQLCSNVEKKILEKEALKTISVKNSDIQFPTLLGKGLQIQKQAEYSTVSVSSILTDRESGINIMEDTIAARTRGALKARESKMTLHVSTVSKYETRTRGRNKNTISDNSVTTHKRSAEYEIQEKDSFKKKKLVSTKNENDKVFKKPKTRAKGKAVKNQETESVKSLDNSTIEESQFFNAPVFFTSSPKISCPSPKPNVAALPPKQSTDRINHSSTSMKGQRLSRKSVNEVVSTPSPAPASNDFINEDKNTESDKNIPTVESNISNNIINLEKTVPGNSNEETKKTGSLSDTPKSESAILRTNESLVKSQDVKDDIETDSRKSNTPESKNLRSEISSSTKMELGDSPKPNATMVLQELEKEIQVPNFKTDEQSLKPVRATRSRSTCLKTQGKNSPDQMRSPSEKHLSPAIEGNLNTTKNIPQASKRTKPVLKSKIFDDKGNILPSESENDSTKKDTADKTYCVRSSPGTHSLNSSAVKANNEKETIEKKSTQNERSKRTRGKDAKKKQEVIDFSADTGRVTRTKTKKAKEEQENAGRKSGLSLLARKSLNKAKMTSLKKERFKAIHNLASRLTNQKGSNQKSSLKVYSHSKNLGSVQAVPCLKSTENLINSGKGKYLPLYNERANALITPAKRGETGDLLIKSAAKIPKENEIDKELKLKALKEKEEEAWVKREMAIKNRQKELKEKNEMKLQSAMKQRQKLETEKHNNILQSEKEKEAKSKLLLQEIELKRKEDVRKKKMEAEKKQAEAEERKRLKEEARKAKEKEQEAERQRILMSKEKEMERHQKWAQERLADEQAREKYENKLKDQLMKAKAVSSKKPDRSETTVTVWNYKSRNENDFGLEDELSENDSNDEEPAPSNRPIPKWAKRVLGKKCPTINCITQEMMAEYMTCHSKTPDIQKMFKMTPRKKIKRTSSAIWNTPSS